MDKKHPDSTTPAHATEGGKPSDAVGGLRRWNHTAANQICLGDAGRPLAVPETEPNDKQVVSVRQRRAILYLYVRYCTLLEANVELYSCWHLTYLS